MTFQSLSSKLWEEDPGYFRLKQSFKTVLAIFLLMSITYNAPLLVKILSAMTASFSMQAIVGDNQKQHLKFVLIAFPIYFICYLIGFFTRAYPILSNSALIILGFIAVYVRQYGPEFGFAPIIAWVFCFLGILLPIPLADYWMVITCLDLGFLVSALIFLLVFPEKKLELYYKNLNVFIKDYARTLQWLTHLLIHRSNLNDFVLEKDRLKMHLFNITLVNGDIAQSQIKSETACATQLQYLYTKQYALAKVLAMIIEGFEELLKGKVVLSDTTRSHLFTVISIYASAICNLSITHTRSNHADVIKTLNIMEDNLDAFQNLLLGCLQRKKLILPLININLGLQLILRNIQNLEHTYEK